MSMSMSMTTKDLWNVTREDLANMNAAELYNFACAAKECARQSRIEAEYDDWAYTNGRMARIRRLASLADEAARMARGEDGLPDIGGASGEGCGG